MPIEEPNLDDQTYEELLSETLRRIPAHTPEWTNYAVESDPGTTLVQLFAFVADNIVYRANRVPEKNRLRFLDLLAIGLQPATAAEGMLQVKNTRGALDPVSLDAGAAFLAGDVRFASLDPLNVLPVESIVMTKQPTDSQAGNVAALYAELDRAINLENDSTYTFYEPTIAPTPTPTDPEPEVDVMESIDRSLYVALVARKGADVVRTREHLLARTLSLGVVPVPEEDGDASVEPAPLGRAEDARAQLTVEVWDVQGDVEAATWRQLSSRCEQSVLNEPGVLSIDLPSSDFPEWSFGEAAIEGKGELPPLVQDEELSARVVLWLRLRPLGGSAAEDGVRAKLRWVGVNAARVRQSIQVNGEFVGTGSGEPDQTLTLAHGPVRAQGLVVAMQAAGAERSLWRRVDDLALYGPDDRVFQLDPEAKTLTFGDGQRGQRPAAGHQVLATYTYGGGPAGNVGIGEIDSSAAAQLQGGFDVANPLPTSGGSGAESTADGERAIASTVRHRGRAVTVEDFQDITRRTPGADVARVEVLPLFRRESPGPVPGVVSVLVIPEGTGAFPSPDAAFLRAVCQHLEPRRLITTELHVIAPSYQDISLSVGLQVRSGRSRETVKESVRQALLAYLAATGSGGPDGADGNGWPLDRDVLQLELFAVAARVPGGRLVEQLLMGDAAGAAIETLSIQGSELPRVIAIGVQEGAAQELAELLGSGDPLLTDLAVGVPIVPETC